MQSTSSMEDLSVREERVMETLAKMSKQVNNKTCRNICNISRTTSLKNDGRVSMLTKRCMEIMHGVIHDYQELSNQILKYDQTQNAKFQRQSKKEDENMMLFDEVNCYIETHRQKKVLSSYDQESQATVSKVGYDSDDSIEYCESDGDCSETTDTILVTPKITIPGRNLCDSSSSKNSRNVPDIKSQLNGKSKEDTFFSRKDLESLLQGKIKSRENELAWGDPNHVNNHIQTQQKSKDCNKRYNKIMKQRTREEQTRCNAFIQKSTDAFRGNGEECVEGDRERVGKKLCKIDDNVIEDDYNDEEQSEGEISDLSDIMVINRNDIIPCENSEVIMLKNRSTNGFNFISRTSSFSKQGNDIATSQKEVRSLQSKNEMNCGNDMFEHEWNAKKSKEDYMNYCTQNISRCYDISENDSTLNVSTINDIVNNHSNCMMNLSNEIKACLNPKMDGNGDILDNIQTETYSYDIKLHQRYAELNKDTISSADNVKSKHHKEFNLKKSLDVNAKICDLAKRVQNLLSGKEILSEAGGCFIDPPGMMRAESECAASNEFSTEGDSDVNYQMLDSQQKMKEMLAEIINHLSNKKNDKTKNLNKDLIYENDENAKCLLSEQDNILVMSQLDLQNLMKGFNEESAKQINVLISEIRDKIAPANQLCIKDRDLKVDHEDHEVSFPQKIIVDQREQSADNIRTECTESEVIQSVSTSAVYGNEDGSPRHIQDNRCTRAEEEKTEDKITKADMIDLLNEFNKDTYKTLQLLIQEMRNSDEEMLKKIEKKIDDRLEKDLIFNKFDDQNNQKKARFCNAETCILRSVLEENIQPDLKSSNLDNDSRKRKNLIKDYFLKEDIELLEKINYFPNHNENQNSHKIEPCHQQIIQDHKKMKHLMDNLMQLFHMEMDVNETNLLSESGYHTTSFNQMDGDVQSDPNNSFDEGSSFDPNSKIQILLEEVQNSNESLKNHFRETMENVCCDISETLGEMNEEQKYCDNVNWYVDSETESDVSSIGHKSHRHRHENIDNRRQVRYSMGSISSFDVISSDENGKNLESVSGCLSRCNKDIRHIQRKIMKDHKEMINVMKDFLKCIQRQHEMKSTTHLVNRESSVESRRGKEQVITHSERMKRRHLDHGRKEDLNDISKKNNLADVTEIQPWMKNYMTDGEELCEIDKSLSTKYTTSHSENDDDTCSESSFSSCKEDVTELEDQIMLEYENKTEENIFETKKVRIEYLRNSCGETSELNSIDYDTSQKTKIDWPSYDGVKEWKREQKPFLNVTNQNNGLGFSHKMIINGNMQNGCLETSNEVKLQNSDSSYSKCNDMDSKKIRVQLNKGEIIKYKEQRGTKFQIPNHVITGLEVKNKVNSSSSVHNEFYDNLMLDIDNQTMKSKKEDPLDDEDFRQSEEFERSLRLIEKQDKNALIVDRFNSLSFDNEETFSEWDEAQGGKVDKKEDLIPVDYWTTSMEALKKNHIKQYTKPVS